MKIFSAILIALFTNTCVAVGWEEISRETVKEFNIEVKVEHDDRGDCHKILAKFPQKLMFSELGSREFGSVRYRRIMEKEKGWQLMSRGTQIDLSTNPEREYNNVGALCLSREDLEFAYLSAFYAGPPGAPPMVIIIKLSDFK